MKRECSCPSPSGIGVPRTQERLCEALKTDNPIYPVTELIGVRWVWGSWVPRFMLQNVMLVVTNVGKKLTS